MKIIWILEEIVIVNHPNKLHRVRKKEKIVIIQRIIRIAILIARLEMLLIYMDSL